MIDATVEFKMSLEDLRRTPNAVIFLPNGRYFTYAELLSMAVGEDGKVHVKAPPINQSETQP